MKTFLGSLMVILWVWSSCPPALAQRPGIPAIEEKLLEWVNKERADRGLGPLELSKDLYAVAKAHSQDMASRRKLDHMSSSGKSYQDRLLGSGMFFIEIGENVAASETYEGDFIHQGFMESPEHRDNILNPHFDAIGIGVAYAKDNKYYVTQDFRQSLEVLDESKVVESLKDKMNRIRRENALPELEFHKTANRFARWHAQKKANGKPLFNIANFFGETRIYFITAPSLSVPESIALEIASGRYETGGIGAWFGRLPDYPGGTYLVALFLFPIDGYRDMQEEDFVKVTLSAINEKRQERGLAPIELDGKKTRQAQDISRQLKDQKENSSITPAGTLRGRVFSYVTENLRIWPALLDSEITDPSLKRIGVGVSAQQDQQTQRQNFFVTLVF